MKSNYWSCSKFANWLRGTVKPASGTQEDWEKWEKLANSKKFRYWLAEEGLDYLQDFIYWPANRMNDLRCYCHNRWITKTHALTSKLQRGQWYDLDTRLLHAIFDELVNHVEIELAWMLVICSDEERHKYKIPWYCNFFRLSSWRCSEAGIAYLEWAAGLIHDEGWIDKNDPEYGQPTSQAFAAQETLALYKWWKELRPNRPDPAIVSGWKDYYEDQQKAAGLDEKSCDNFILHNEDKEHYFNILDIHHQIEKEQVDEDTAMLIRLIKIRQGLWT